MELSPINIRMYSVIRWQEIVLAAGRRHLNGRAVVAQGRAAAAGVHAHAAAHIHIPVGRHSAAGREVGRAVPAAAAELNSHV